MHIQAGPFHYTWIENWAKIPPSTGFAHHGMAIAPDGTIFTGDVTEPRVHVLTPAGDPVRSFDIPVSEVHGITFAQERDQTILLIADTGEKGIPKRSGPSTIIKCDTEGNVLGNITPDDLAYASNEPCKLTACAQDPDTGNIWIADGYGSSKVHCISPGGKRLLTLDGTEANLGAFRTPHWIWVDRRKGHSEIYVADRTNHRVLVYTTDGQLLRCLDHGFRFPSGFATFGDILIVAELAAGVVLLDKDDQIIAHIGVHREATERPGWPNSKDDDGKTVPPHLHLEPGHFNSPHGIAADPAGNIYISEWLLGGRYICLQRCQNPS